MTQQKTFSEKLVFWGKYAMSIHYMYFQEL